MVDSERLDALRTLTDLYRPSDFIPARSSMPRFTSDESGAEFNEYFDFLQRIYLLQSDYYNMDADEIIEEATELRELAKKYKYPSNQIEVFLDDVSETS